MCFVVFLSGLLSVCKLAVIQAAKCASAEERISPRCSVGKEVGDGGSQSPNCRFFSSSAHNSQGCSREHRDSKQKDRNNQPVWDPEATRTWTEGGCRIVCGGGEP